MKDRWEKDFKKIDRVEGLLVPGQERVLFDMAAIVKPGGVIVEIGSFKGRSTACLALGRSGKNIKIYAIDTFRGNDKDFYRGNQFKERQFLTIFKRNMKNLNLRNIRAVQGYSSDIGRKWKRPIDLLFIDGSHIYEDVKLDFELFFPWVKPGGLVLFHDVDPAFPGVYRVWHETAKDKLSYQGNLRTLYFGSKPKWKVLVRPMYLFRWVRYFFEEIGKEMGQHPFAKRVTPRVRLIKKRIRQFYLDQLHREHKSKSLFPFDKF